MNRILLKITVLMSIFLLSGSLAMAKNLNIWGLINKDISKLTKDGETSESDFFTQSYRLSFKKPITPVIRYSLDVRAHLSDSDFTDSEGKTTKSYKREIEPALDLSISNPMYSLGSGYRRREEWSTKDLKNNSRKTTDFYYSGFSVNPRALPTLNLRFNREKIYDHLPDRETDTTNTNYTANSGYNLPSADVKFNYNLSFSHNIEETPLVIVSKIETDIFNGSYDIGYFKYFWKNRVSLSTGYQGNYSWNKSKQFVSQTGNVLFERTPFGGLHALGTVLKPDADTLLSESLLVNNDLSTGISNINLSTEQFHNIGIWVAPDKSVDRLYIYVNKDITGDSNLINAANWTVLKSDFNLAGTWTDVAINSVTATTVDIFDNIYRYEIEFSNPETASYFNAINLEVSDALGITDVQVTEIEAYGTDVVPSTGQISNESKFFSQRFSLGTSIVPVQKLTLSASFSADRSDQNPDSPLNSARNFMRDMFTNPDINEDDPDTSNISRNYSASAHWLTHRLLTTVLNFSRSEGFTTNGSTDFFSDTYSLTFNATPLPTLDTNLTFINNERYSFDDKDSSNNSILLSIGSKLYRNLNMITDMIYSQTKDFTPEKETVSYSINGTIDAQFTSRLSGNFTYSLNWISSEGTDSHSKNSRTIVSYQPGRFINFSGNFFISDSDGDISTSEGVTIDWLTLRDISLNIGYQHSNEETPSSTSDRAQGQVKWFINKFADMLVSYSYSRNSQETTTEAHSFLTSLNCRF